MRNTRGTLGRAADAVMALDSPAYGDERERAAFMEATTFGFTIGIYVNLAVAFVAAVLGGLLLPAVLLLVMAVPTWSAIWWASARHGVDISDLADRAEPRSRTTVRLVVVGGMFLTVAAMAYTVFTGHGLAVPPHVDVTGPDTGGFVGGLVQGAVVGGMIGLLAFTVLSATRRRRGTPPVPAGPDLDDDE
jgi:tetrahydromethanopterin S-methyltransferase subunit B